MNTWIISPNWIAWTLLGVATASLVAIVVCSIVFIRRNNPSKNQDSTSPIESPQNAKDINRLKSSVTALSIVVTIIFIWLCYACWCDLKFGSDSSAGALMTALGIMVTALIGWQVFNAIENVKTLKKMEGLESELRSKSELIVTLNDQLLDIIEAHHERTVAQGINYWEYKYEHAIKAIKLFVRGNIRIDYEPFQQLLLDMSSIISHVDNASQDDKIVFARSFPKYDIEHEEIMELIHQRQNHLKALSKTVMRLRDRRKKLFDDYAKMKTTHEIEEEAEPKPATPPDPAGQ